MMTLIYAYLACSAIATVVLAWMIHRAKVRAELHGYEEDDK